ncbi:flagellar export chaperone FlgN [Oxalobacteraceae sp. CFBP 8755]|nr:flagellar export chaperone FlgN [Oxalobacteraceae sp. CFBP 8761]MBD8628377.1 flagellar export chaperone FlgN [Oxalobacteraceae sp. CFBP 8753]MBD8632836.1 flagellar export chaperone FlgN [Oxalobacteraceae sp. CFBP 8755]
MATLTRTQANTLLADGVTQDVKEAANILMLLERQFDAAVRHRSAELSALADELTPLLDAMEARRQQRVNLVRALLGPQGTMAQYSATLAPAPRAAFEAAWQALEQTVRACKEATLRNGQLLAEQHGIMQRVLHGEEQLYAPR